MNNPHIYQRPGSKIWYIDVSIDGRRIRKSIGQDKHLAQLAAADLIIAKAQNRAGFFNRKISLIQFFSETRDRISRHSQNTCQRYGEVLSHFEDFLKPYNLKFLSDISSDFIDQYIRSRQSAISQNTINYELSKLHSFFLHYVRSNALKESPVQNIVRFKKERTTPRYLSTQEIEKLFQFITPRFYPHYTVLLNTGIRLGEFLNLTWQDVDFEKKTLYIRPKEDWQPKSKDSIRQIPLNEAALKAFSQRKNINESEAYCFSSAKGTRLSKNVMRNTLLKAAAKAGIRNITVHTFRHTFASHLVQQDESIYKVKALLGHSSVKQTEIYAHLAPQNGDSVNKLHFNI